MPNPRDRQPWLAAVVLSAAGVVVSPAWYVSAQDAPPAEAEPADSQPGGELPLPPGLPAELLAPEPGTEAADRLNATIDEALEGVEPATFDRADEVDAPVELPRQAADALARASELLDEGRHFEAAEALRSAERLVPEHPGVVRALGLAYVAGGNGVRGRDYLERAASMVPGDAGVRVVLSRLALERRGWVEALSLAAAIDRAAESSGESLPSASLYADYVRAVALDREGYTAAAAGLYLSVLNADQAPSDADSAAGRELFILRARQAELSQRLGDLRLRLGRPAEALSRYEQADPAETPDPAAHAARLAYARLLMGRPDAAAEGVVAFLESPGATEADAALVRYLTEQGVDPARLDAMLVAAAARAPAGHFALVAARAAVLPQPRTVGLIDDWLADQPPRLATFRRAIALLRGGKGDDPDALARALALTARAMGRQPDRAGDYAQALLDLPIDPVAMLRALNRPAVSDTDDTSLLYLSALAYRQVGRVEDARHALDRTLMLDHTHRGARLAMVRVLIDLGADDPPKLVRAASLLGEVAADGPEDRFLARVDILRGQEQYLAAQRLIRDRLRSRAGSVELVLLDAQVKAEGGDVTRSIALYEDLLRRYPADERIYCDGLDLIGFIEDDRDRMRYSVLLDRLRAGLNEHLPESRTARMEQARDYYYGQNNPAAAMRLIDGLLAEDPADGDALILGYRALRELGEADASDDALRRWVELRPPGVERVIMLADVYRRRGELAAMTELLTETLAQEEEGVLPGPAMTADDAAEMLYLLSLSQGNAATEPLYIGMLRRFPDNARLNNGLGYRWAVEGKELLAAEAMIQRSLDAAGDVSSYLDSMGWVLYKMQRYAEAEAYLRRAIQRQGEELRASGRPGGGSKAVLYDHLGDILYRQGEAAAAVRHWVIARSQTVTDAEASGDPEAATVIERTTAKAAAVQEGLEPAIEDAPGEAAFGRGGHPSEWPG